MPRRPLAAAEGSAPRDSFPEAAPAALPRARGKALYRALFELLRDAIAAGHWQPGELLPSEASLCARYGVSRITVRHALNLLQGEGHIRTRRAHRAMVLARDPLAQAGVSFDSLTELIEAAGGYQLRLVGWRHEVAPGVGPVLEMPPEAELRCLRGLLLRDGHKVARTTMYFHPSVGDRLELADFDDPVVFRVLQRKLGVRIADVRMTVWADLAGPDDAAQLDCAMGSAMFCTRLVFRNEAGLPFEVTYSRFPAALHRLAFRIDVTDG